MDDRRIKIKRILNEHPHIKSKDVAYAVGLSDATFSYQMNDAIKFDGELEANIYKYFNKKGIIKYQEGNAVWLTICF
ncbi:MAG: hypothetical protein IPL84_03955 [Chitinophagaceae bacterium]|nr:hypothetical protein [Chitinophagaceae bacterium]